MVSGAYFSFFQGIKVFSKSIIVFSKGAATVALAEQHFFCHRLPENMVFASWKQVPKPMST